MTAAPNVRHQAWLEAGAWPIIVSGIVLDDFANGNGLTQFVDTDMAHDTVVHGVLGELELTTCIFLPRMSSIITMG